MKLKIKVFDDIHRVLFDGTSDNMELLANIGNCGANSTKY